MALSKSRECEIVPERLNNGKSMMFTFFKKWKYRLDARVEVHALLFSFVKAGEKFKTYNFSPIYDSAFIQKLSIADAACLCAAAYLETMIEGLPEHIRENVLSDFQRVPLDYMQEIAYSLVIGPPKENVLNLIPATVLIGFTISMTLLYFRQGKITAEYKDLLISEIFGLLQGKSTMERRNDRFDNLFKI